MDGTAEILEDLERSARVALDLRVDLEIAEVHRERDLPAADGFELFGDEDPFAQRAKVAEMRPRHDVLHERRIPDAARDRPVVQQKLERMIKIERISAEWRLVAPDPTGRGREADAGGATRAGREGR